MSLETFWHVQTALHGQLAGYAPLTALLAAGADSVLDHVPQDTAFPYIAMGEMAARPLEATEQAPYEIDMTLHAYSQAAGMREIKRIMSAVNAALQSGGINIAGHVMVLCRALESEARLEKDGVTRHARMRFRLIVEPTV